MKNVSKEQLYNWAVEVYLKTGQGLSGIIFTKIGREPLDELVAEGKVKVIKQPYSYLPSDEWVCLTGVYCVEDFYAEKNHRPLNFIRRYLGQPRDSVIDQKVDEFLAKNPKKKEEYEKEYEDWLTENKDFLEQSFKIQKMEIPTEPTKYKLDKELTEYIKETNWFQDNYSISKTLNLINRKLFLNNELKNLLKQLLNSSEKRTEEEKEKDRKQLLNVETEIKLDGKIRNILFNASNIRVPIKEYFEKYEI